MLTLADPLDHARKLHASRVAVIDGLRSLTFGELAARGARLVQALRALGVSPGDRVAILAANGHRYLEAFCSLPAHGIVLVPLNTRLAPLELQTIVEHAAPKVLLTDRDVGALAASVPHVIAMPDAYESLLEGRDAMPQAAALASGMPSESDVAVIFYTGGTTGTPKGVMLTHRNLVANAFHKTVACSLAGTDVFLGAPAMFHVAGIAPLVGLMWLGATTVTLPAFDPDACLDAIERHRISVFMPVPTMLVALTEAQRARPRDVSSLRLLGHAGSSITNEAIEAAHAVFPGCELAQFYGATETSSVVTCFRDEQRSIGTSRLGSAGRATPGVSVRILNESGAECAPCEVGEIVVRGPNVAAGYYRDEVTTAAAFRAGSYFSGDLGYLDADGYLFVVDRLKDMIVSGGENVYSIEVEDALGRHPAVLESAVLGVPHAVWGEAVHAVCVVRADAAERPSAELIAELQACCRARIAGYKVPKSWSLQREPLPKSGPGKVLKRLLRERHVSAVRAAGERGAKESG